MVPSTHIFSGDGKGPAAGDPCTIRTGLFVQRLAPAAPGHFTLMPANLITLAHFGVSAAMCLPKSSGVIGIGTPPRSAIRTFNLGSASPALISLLILATMSAGVPLGAPTPYHWLDSKPGRNSPTVGTSGNASERVAV